MSLHDCTTRQTSHQMSLMIVPSIPPTDVGPPYLYQTSHQMSLYTCTKHPIRCPSILVPSIPLDVPLYLYQASQQMSLHACTRHPTKCSSIIVPGIPPDVPPCLYKASNQMFLHNCTRNPTRCRSMLVPGIPPSICPSMIILGILPSVLWFCNENWLILLQFNCSFPHSILN